MRVNKNKIIKNIYYMLSYAFQNLTQNTYEDIAGEEFDEIYNLLSAIISKGIAVQVKQGLFKEYVNINDDLNKLRGKINIHNSIKKKLERKKSLNCDFDDFSENNQFNQIIKSTVMLLITNKKVDVKFKDELRKEMLFFSNVDLIELSNVKWASIRFQRNNQTYRMLISLCQLIFQGLLLTTDKGEYKLGNFFNEKEFCTLYEKFILEYYYKHYPQLSVKASKIEWSLDDGIGTLLPEMQSDIYLSLGEKVLIIDAKYYSHSMQKYFDTLTIHSGNLYQIFTYVKNEQYKDSSKEVSGMLLYARTEDEVQPDNSYQMHGNKIMVKTLDLNQDFDAISEQLDCIAKSYFGALNKIK